MSIRNIIYIFIFLLIPLSAANYSTLLGAETGIVKLQYVHAGRDIQGELESISVLGIDFISVREFADLIQSHVFWISETRKFTIYFENLEVKFAANNPFVMIGKNVYQMPMETLWINNEIYAPVPYLILLLEYYIPEHYFRYKPSQANISQIPSYSDNNITGVTLENKENGTLLRFSATRQFSQLKNWEIGSEFTFEVYEGQIDTIQFYIPPPTGIVKEIIPIQLSNTLQFILKLSEKPEDYYIEQNERTNEISVGLIRKMSDAERTRVNVDAAIKQQQEAWEIDTIVLDAGHGGKDPGAIGRRNTEEKAIVLSITELLGSLLSSKLDLKVVYTRETDKFLELKKRTEIANLENGKLFISIHCNSIRNSSTSGVETYILRPGREQSAINTAERENQVVKEYEENEEAYGDIGDDNYILSSIMESGFIGESEILASRINKHLTNKTKAKDRGVKQALFLVLINASMPRVLIEVGFLSNSGEEQKLRTRSYQQLIAEGIYEGIKEFIQDSNQQAEL